MTSATGATERPLNGLILTGGGARAAYQAGVLRAIAEMLPDAAHNPFSVVTGTSAGSINALLLASRVDHFSDAVSHMNAIWRNLTVDKVFRTDTGTMLRTGLRWLAWLTLLRNPRWAPRALLDNAPLRHMLESHCRLARVPQAVEAGYLRALAITAAGYGSGRSVTFFQGRSDLDDWSRTRRDGMAVELTLDHVMASVALPLVFPAVRIGGEYYGDGSMRQAAPLSAPIHLGATRLLVIGMRNEDPRGASAVGGEYPSFGEIAGYVLDSLFMDSLYADIERLRRINELVRQLARQGQAGDKLREIDVNVIVPSVDIRDIAQRHQRRLPRTLKTLLRLLGATRQGGSQFASYLIFDGAYCRELIELGYQDGLRHRTVLEKFATDAAPAGKPKTVALNSAG